MKKISKHSFRKTAALSAALMFALPPIGKAQNLENEVRSTVPSIHYTSHANLQYDSLKLQNNLFTTFYLSNQDQRQISNQSFPRASLITPRRSYLDSQMRLNTTALSNEHKEKKYDTPLWLLSGTLFLSTIYDNETTFECLREKACYETNPLRAQVMKGGRPALYAYDFALNAAFIAISAHFRKSHNFFIRNIGGLGILAYETIVKTYAAIENQKILDGINNTLTITIIK